MKNILIIISFVLLICIFIISCGGGTPKPPPVSEVPDIVVNEILDTLVTIVTENATPSEHRDPSTPIVLSNSNNFRLDIEKRRGISYTVSFNSVVQQYINGTSHCCFSIDISSIAAGTYPVKITASNALSTKRSQRSSKTVELWVRVNNSPPAKAFNPLPSNNSSNVTTKNLLICPQK